MLVVVQVVLSLFQALRVVRDRQNRLGRGKKKISTSHADFRSLVRVRPNCLRGLKRLFFSTRSLGHMSNAFSVRPNK